jgi:SAM-dependent methyltransferase
MSILSDKVGREGHKLENSSVLSKIKAEINHWLRSEWSLAEVGEHWDSVEEYDEINQETYSYFRRFIDGLRLSKIDPDSRILDFCARTGNGSAYFFQNGRIGSAICADVSYRMGGVCSSRLRELGFEKFLWVPVLDFPLPFARESFDATLCFETVEHVPDPGVLISELGRVTRTGGTLVLTTPNVLWEPVHAVAAVTGWHHSEGPHHFIPYRKLIRMVKEAGFSIEAAETTVLVPGGPDWLVKMGQRIEEGTRHTLMPLVGLRRVVIGRKL